MAYIPNLKTWRLAASMSQSELARLAGVDRATLARAENAYSAQETKCHAILQALIDSGKCRHAIDPTVAIVDGGQPGPMKKRTADTAAKGR